METQLYQKTDSSFWQGRKDSENAYIYQFVKPINLKSNSTFKDGFGILGFNSDEGILRNYGRIGAKEGPNALRKRLGKLPYLRKDKKAIFDFGNVYCEDNHLEKSQEFFGELLFQLLNCNIYPILIGGGHEIAFATYLGIKKKIKQEELTIINFDAHYDLRKQIDSKGTSGTSFYQIAQERFSSNLTFNYFCFGIQKYSNSLELHERALEYKTQIFFAEDFFLYPLEFFQNELKKIIDHSKNIYVSICLDVFNQSIAPGVSAPQPLGLNPWHVIPLLRQLALSKKIVGIEVAELSPSLDNNDSTCALAAYLLCDYIHNANF